MDFRRCNIRVSWRTQLLLLVTHGVLVLAILFAPWPTGYNCWWLILLILVVVECIRSQTQIAKNYGELDILDNQHFVWHRQEWRLYRTPWISDYGIILLLRTVQGNDKKLRLWLAVDSMTPEEWRQLRAILLQLKNNHRKVLKK